MVNLGNTMVARAPFAEIAELYGPSMRPPLPVRFIYLAAYCLGGE